MSRAVLRHVLAVLLALTAWALLAARPCAQAATDPLDSGGQPPRQVVEALVVKIDGVIGVPTVALVRRAVSEAAELGVVWLVLDIDTPGGRIDSMRDVQTLLETLRESRQVTTVAYVRRHALSAGAYIALACSQTYMAEGAILGAITPVLAGPGGSMQIPEDDVRRKAYSAMRADVRALAEARNLEGDSLTIAEAMVDPTMRVFDVTYEDEQGADIARVLTEDDVRDLETRGVRVRSREEFGSTPLTLTAREAVRFGFSSGTYDRIDDALRDALGVDPDRARRMRESWSESTADWLEGMKPILFILGFILLLVELKIPGFGVPGALGILLLGLGMFSSYLVGLAAWTEILLFVLGLVFIGVEIFVVPGTVISGAAGFVALVAALILSQQRFVIPENASQRAILEDNLLNLLKLLLFVVVGSFIVYRLLPKIPILNRVLLTPPPEPRTGDASSYAAAAAAAGSTLVGKTGVATTDLRPAGVAEIDGERYDVVAEGGFFELGTKLRVLEVAGNRIVVVRDGIAGSEAGEVAIGWLLIMVVVGLCLVIAEVFFVSMGILGTCAAVSLVSAVFLAFTQHGQAIGFLFLAMASIGAPLAMFWALKTLPKTKLGNALILQGPAHDDVARAGQQPGLEALDGQSGTALSDLRPSGFARIGGRRVDVVSRGEMIESGASLRVLAVEGNRVVVAKVDGAPPPASLSHPTSP